MRINSRPRFVAALAVATMFVAGVLFLAARPADAGDTRRLCRTECPPPPTCGCTSIVPGTLVTFPPVTEPEPTSTTTTSTTEAPTTTEAPPVTVTVPVPVPGPTVTVPVPGPTVVIEREVAAAPIVVATPRFTG